MVSERVSTLTGKENLDPSIRALLDRLSVKEAAYRSVACCPEFLSLCQDFVAALEVKDAWSEKPDVAHQFWCIAIEIEDEIRLLLGVAKEG